MPLPDPSIITTGTGTGTTTVLSGSMVSKVDLSTIITQIKAQMPFIRFAYTAYKAYMLVTQRGGTSTIYGDAEKLIAPILAKKPEEVTDDEIGTFIGAFAAVLEQAGKDVVQKILPLVGSDLLPVLSAFGLLAV